MESMYVIMYIIDTNVITSPHIVLWGCQNSFTSLDDLQEHADTTTFPSLTPHHQWLDSSTIGREAVRAMVICSHLANILPPAMLDVNLAKDF